MQRCEVASSSSTSLRDRVPVQACNLGGERFEAAGMLAHLLNLCSREPAKQGQSDLFDVLSRVYRATIQLVLLTSASFILCPKGSAFAARRGACNEEPRLDHLDGYADDDGPFRTGLVWYPAKLVSHPSDGQFDLAQLRFREPARSSDAPDKLSDGSNLVGTSSHRQLAIVVRMRRRRRGHCRTA